MRIVKGSVLPVVEDNIESIKLDLNNRQFKKIRLKLKEMEVANVSELLAEVNIDEAIILLRLISRTKRALVFSYTPFDRQEQMLERLPEPVGLSLLNEMEPVDRTRLLEELPSELSTHLITKLNPEERKMAWQLLSYPEDSVGRIMGPEFIALPEGLSVSQALEDIRWQGGKYRESIVHHIFVVASDKKLMGHVSLASLVLADPPNQNIATLIDTTQESLSPLDDQSLAVDYFRKFDRTYIPVVDEHERLVGIVEADDVFDVAEEEATEDIQAFGGQSSLEDSYFQTPFFTLLQKRGSWLSLIFLMSMFSANALEGFSSVIKSMTFLVFFLPLVIASGGNSGAQAASLIIRGLAVREMQESDWLRVFVRELLIGMCLGALLGFMGFWRAVWIGDLGIVAGVSVAVSLVLVVTFGAVAGAMLPFMLKSLKLDPAVSSSPVIASLVDLFGIMVLFQLAASLGKWLL